MNISEPFIRRPIATALLMAALLVGGMIGYSLLPVAALPTVDFPTISVSAMLPGIGQVVIFGQQKYAPTIQVNPTALAARGLGIDDVATAVANSTVELPLGTLQGQQQAYQIGANSQLVQPSALGQVIVAY